MLKEENPKWWQSAVVYQIYPQSFQDSNGDGIGDLDGIRERLPYIKQLGANVIWLNPIYESPGKDNGYDISNYRKINPKYGNLGSFKKLLNTAHELGIHILMDLVVNHTSDKHPWFKESRKSKTNPYRDYYTWRDPKDGKEPNNWTSFFSGPAWKYDETTGQYYLHLFAEGQPDLNWENPEVRSEVKKIMRFWLNLGVDGFRMDAINMISKPKGLPDAPVAQGAAYPEPGELIANGPKLNEYLKELYRDVLADDNYMTVGEMAQTSPKQAIEYTGFNRQELNMVFQFDHVGLGENKDRRFGKWNDESIKLSELKAVFNNWETQLNGKGWNSLYWNNHDQPRAVSRFSNDSEEFRDKAAKMLGATLHMMQGTPYIYQGEELGMTNAHFDEINQYEDIEALNAFHQFVNSEHAVSAGKMLSYLSDRSRDNARTPMQWDNSQNAGFSDKEPWFTVNPNHREINVQRQIDDEDSVLSFYRRLIELRRKYPIVLWGNFELLNPKDNKVFGYKRHLNNQTLMLLSNFTNLEISQHYPVLDTAKRLIGNYTDKGQDSPLQPYETRVYIE